MASRLRLPLGVILLLILGPGLLFAKDFFELQIDNFITQDKCRDAVWNCTTHWDMIPYIAPVGLCEEYFPIECMTELVVSSHCMDEPGYGAFLMDIAVEVEDCVKSGMRWTVVFLKRLIRKAINHILCHQVQNVCYNVTNWKPENKSCDLDFAACIMDTYAEEYCKEFEDDLELAFYRCLSGAMACDNKKEVITECEKEYLGAVQRITKNIDIQRGIAEKNETYKMTLRDAFKQLSFNALKPQL